MVFRKHFNSADLNRSEDIQEVLILWNNVIVLTAEQTSILDKALSQIRSQGSLLYCWLAETCRNCKLSDNTPT